MPRWDREHRRCRECGHLTYHIMGVCCRCTMKEQEAEG